MLNILLTESEKELLNHSYKLINKWGKPANFPGYVELENVIRAYVAATERNNILAENDVNVLYANGTLMVETELAEGQIREVVDNLIKRLKETAR